MTYVCVYIYIYKDIETPECFDKSQPSVAATWLP